MITKAQVVTISPSPVVDSTESITITFHPYGDTFRGYTGDTLLRYTTGSVYIYTGVLPRPTPGAGDWIHTNTSGWGASDPYYKMTRIDSNDYTYTFSNLRAYYGLAGTDTSIDSMALIFTSGNGDTQTSNIYIPVVQPTLITPAYGPAVTTVPSVVTDSVERVVISFHPYFDTLTGYSGDAQLRYASPPLYIYTGVLLNPSAAPGTWYYTNSTGWGASDPYYRMTYVDSNTYNYTIPDIRSYYGVAGDTTHIDSIGIIFTTGNGDLQTSNFYIPLTRPQVAATTGVQTVSVTSSNLSLQLVPNPATNEVSAIIGTNINGEARIRIMNQLGQCILTKNIDSKVGRVDLPLNDMPAGSYFVELAAGDKKVVQNLLKR